MHYSFRKGQEEVLKRLSESLKEKKEVCLQAPAGYGKTFLALIALREFIKKGYRIIWAVRTGNETDRPIEEAKKLGFSIPAISLRGKKDMCLLAKKVKAGTYEGVEALCRLKKNTCPYYRRLNEYGPEIYGPTTFSEIYSQAKKSGTCPYYLQHKLLRRVKLVSLSYNYVFTPAMWSIRSKVPFGRSILVVDEAHNLQHMAYDLNSDYISTFSISRAERELQKLGESVRLGGLKGAVKKLEGRMLFGETVFSPRNLLEEAGLTERDLIKLYRLGEEVQRLRAEEGKEPRSSLHHLAKFFLYALEKEGEEGIVFLAIREGRKIRLEMRDLRASEFLKNVWPDFYRVILMSGTLRPVRAFAEIVGLEDYAEVVGEWQYNYRGIRSFIVDGISTKGEELPPEMAEKYSKMVLTVTRKIPENIAVFTASYRILEELKTRLNGSDRRLFVEEKGMSGRKASRILKEFKESRGEGLLLATCAGRFAEGADFPGEALRAVIIAGIPYDRMTLATKLYISYFKRIYGAKGRYYAYILPAMRRVNQALGRVIREEGEGGIFILADERFRTKTHFRLLSRYIRKTVKRVKLVELWDALEAAYREVFSS